MLVWLAGAGPAALHPALTTCMVMQAIGIFGIGPTHLFIRWRRSPPAPHLILIQPPSRGTFLKMIFPWRVEHVDRGGVGGGVAVAVVGGILTVVLSLPPSQE